MDKVAILLHTKNRPRFLIRTVRFLLQNTWYEIFISDSSTAEYASSVTAELDEIVRSNRVHHIRHDCDTTYPERFRHLLSRSKSPYVLLAADSDFYSPVWIKNAEKMLDRLPDIVAVTGQYARFEIPVNEPYGDANLVSKSSKTYQYLYDSPTESSLKNRLLKFKGKEVSSAGWYALQRREVLDFTVGVALSNNIDDSGFEILLALIQCVKGNLICANEVSLLRQTFIHSPPRHGLSYSLERRNFQRIYRALINVLRDHESMSLDEASAVIHDTMKYTIISSKYIDARHSAAPNEPLLQQALNLMRTRVALWALKSRRETAASHPPFVSDDQFFSLIKSYTNNEQIQVD